MRLCTVDIGTNSVRALVADIERPGQIRVVHRQGHITRLGQMLSRCGFLNQPAIERTATAVQQIVAEARELGAEGFKIVATSAARNASNPQDLKDRIRDLTSLEMEIISGLQEAAYICRGVLSTVNLHEKPLLMADIGGGSTELILARPGQQPLHGSVDAGAVYLMERFILYDPPLSSEQSAVLQHATHAFREACGRFPSAAEELIGLGGTITTIPPILMEMEEYDPSRVHNFVLTLTQVKSLLNRLASMPLLQRVKVKGLETGRADVIVAGILILQALLDVTGFDRIRVSDRGILFGLALSILPEAS